MRLNKSLLTLLFFAIVVNARPAFATNYIYTDLDLLTGGSSMPASINNSGQVVGGTITPSNLSLTFLYNNGNMQDLGVYGINSGANGINNSGQIVGNTGSGSAFLYNNGSMQILSGLSGASKINESGQIVGTVNYFNTAYHAALYTNGIVQDLGAMGGLNSSASDINNSGQIVGTVTMANNQYHAFAYNNGVMQDIGTLGGQTSFGNSINNNSEVVGGAYTAKDEYHAYLYKDGNMQDLGTMGGTASYANDINNSGQIVGVAFMDQYIQSRRAFLYSNGTMTDLNSLLDESVVSAGWVLQGATAINDNGWITGFARNSITNTYHAFLLSPTAVPETDTYAMMLGGLGLISFVVRRNKKE
jgi:probable HAF family extracellular repeat protein